MEPIYVYIDFPEIEMPVEIYKGTDERVVHGLLSDSNVRNIHCSTSATEIYAEREGEMLDPHTLEPMAEVNGDTFDEYEAPIFGEGI